MTFSHVRYAINLKGAALPIAFSALLGLSCLGAAACTVQGGDSAAPDAEAQEEAAAVDPSEYAVELPGVSSDELLAAAQTEVEAMQAQEADGEADVDDEGNESDANEAAAQVTSVDVAVDDAARRVDMTVVVDGGDVAAVTACAEAAARALSGLATVTGPAGEAAPDDGPCGALYEAYSLYLRAYNGVTGEFFDGTLAAGADEIMWQ